MDIWEREEEPVLVSLSEAADLCHYPVIIIVVFVVVVVVVIADAA
jgi:hypothetical protein